MCTIAIAEDIAQMREHIASIIQQSHDYTLSFAAPDGFQLLQYLNTIRTLPEFILVDIRMPFIDGLFATDYICSHYPSISVVAISISNDPAIVLDFVNAGAKGFLLKSNLNHKTLKQSLTTIAENRFFFDEHIKDKEIFDTAVFLKPGTCHPINRILNEKEKKYIQLSATMATNSQIAALLNIAESSLTNYQKEIKEKTGFSTRHELMAYAIQEGIAKVARFHPTPLIKYSVDL